jgi:hypothetical protein
MAAKKNTPIGLPLGHSVKIDPPRSRCLFRLEIVRNSSERPSAREANQPSNREQAGLHCYAAAAAAAAAVAGTGLSAAARRPPKRKVSQSAGLSDREETFSRNCSCGRSALICTDCGWSFPYRMTGWCLGRQRGAVRHTARGAYGSKMVCRNASTGCILRLTNIPATLRLSTPMGVNII